MTKVEFKTRTGVEVSDADFDAINEAYLGTPMDKDAFCTCLKSAETRTLVISLGSTIRTEKHFKRAAEDCRNKLVDYLFELNINYDTEALTAKVRELLGRDEYLARMVEAGETIEDEDLAYIAAKIRRQ